MSKKASKLLWKRISTSYKYLKISWTVQVREFFEYSTLHGVKYIAEHGRPFLERFLWFVCVLIGAVATVVVIFSLWEKFQTNPTITGLDTDFHNWEVPFPAVILCPTDPAKQEQIRRLLDITENSTTQDLQKADFIYDLTKLDFNSIPIFTKKYTEADTYVDKNEDIRNYIYKFMDDCTDVFDNCSFKDTPFGCCSAPDKRFTPVFTETGFCHSFNSRHFRRSNNTASAEPEQFNMQYIKEADTKWSLQFALKTGEAVTSIYILNSDEMVSMNIQPQLEWDYQVYKMAFSMKQTYTTEDTRQLSIKQRKCVFGDEIPLHVDSFYTHSACTIQCRMENARKFCGCVPHFYPSVADFPYCTLERLECVAKNFEAVKSIDRCNCQLGCRNIVYEIEAQYSKSMDVTVNEMDIGFVSWPMVRYKREVLFGWVDLLVSFGGIAGLFLGFSLLSVVEIFYYFIIRACIAAFKERPQLDRIKKEQESRPIPPYDLSLVPYFFSDPLPGGGIDVILKIYEKSTFRKMFNKNKIGFSLNGKPPEKWATRKNIVSPFGIEFVN